MRGENDGKKEILMIIMILYTQLSESIGKKIIIQNKAQERNKER